MNKFKYRQYWFDKGKLTKITQLRKLPREAMKPKKEVNVWVTSSYCGIWSKICRLDSDIDFGTGRTELLRFGSDMK